MWTKIVLQLELLAHELQRKSYYLTDQSIKNNQDKKVLAAAITSLIREYNYKAVQIARQRNIDLGFEGANPSIDLDLPMNGETVFDRINKYTSDLDEDITRFKELDNPLLIGLGLGLLSLPFYKDIEKARLKKQVVEGKRGAASSAAFLSNLDRNLFGSIFYSERMADHNVWRTKDLRAIRVFTAGDAYVCDQCKAMAGIYPPDYVFIGNHSRCRCGAEPILIGPYRQDMDGRILAYALANKYKFGKLMIYQLNAKYLDV